MTIKITIINHLTQEVIVDNIIEVPNDYAIFEANHKCMAEAFPDCGVTFEQMDGNSFIFSMPVNQKKDEILCYAENGQMTWEDYYAKWHIDMPA